MSDLIEKREDLQPTCNQLATGTISRQAAIDTMCDACSDWCDEGVCKRVSAIQKLPSAQQWIPCSEKLPEEETDVLVTRKFLGCKDSSHGWNNHIPPTTYVEVAQYFNGEWTALSDEYKVARNRHTEPIAWMPLPEPYNTERRKDGKTN